MKHLIPRNTQQVGHKRINFKYKTKYLPMVANHNKNHVLLLLLTSGFDSILINKAI